MRRVIILFLILFSIVANAQIQTFTIVGKLDASRANRIYLYIADIISETNRSDSTAIQNGEFVFTGNIRMPLKGILISTPDNNRLDFYIEPGNIKIFSRDSLQNAVAKAGRLNEDFLKLRKITDVIDNDMRSYNRTMQAAVSALPEKRTDEQFQMAWKSKRTISLRKLNEANIKFVENNPDNLASIYALANFGGSNPDLDIVVPLFQNLSETVRHSELGKVYHKKLEKLATIGIGAAAPEFTQPDVNGHPVSLSDYRGKYVLIDFWASWCGPCRQENPNLIRAFELYKNDNFTVLGISLDKMSAKDAWLKAIAKDGLPWTQLSDLKGWDNEVSKLYDVKAIPKNFLVDPAGKIIATNLHGSVLDKKLSEILGKRQN